MSFIFAIPAFSAIFGTDIMYLIKFSKRIPGSTLYTRYQGGDSLVVRRSQIHIPETQGVRCATMEG